MKKILLSLGVALLFTHYGWSQNNTTTELIDLKEWTTALQLDQPQQEQLKQIEYTRAIQLQDLKTIKDMDAKLYNNKLQALNANTLAKLRNILRLEQLNIYQKEVERRAKEKQANVVKR